MALDMLGCVVGFAGYISPSHPYLQSSGTQRPMESGGGLLAHVRHTGKVASLFKGLKRKWLVLVELWDKT